MPRSHFSTYIICALWGCCTLRGRGAASMKWALKWALLSLLLAPLSHIHAQSLQRKQTAVGVTERKRTKRKPMPERKEPRISRAALIATTIEVRLIKGIDKTLMQMRNIASKLPKRSEKRLEVMKRMLQLQLEQAAYITSQEYENYEQKWQAWVARGQRGVEPQLVHTKSNRMWLKFINLSSTLIKEFPKNKELDSIIYNQALGLQFLGREDEAARSLSQLIQKYPNSSIAGDAYHSLGDYYFNKSEFAKARSNYQKVIRTYKNSQRYLWSLFKLGWTYFNLEDYRRALTYWKQTIARSSSGGKSARILRDEALRDIVYAFAEIGDVAQALSYFRSHGGQEYVGKFLNLLANILMDQGKFRKAIEVFHKLQTSAPNTAEAPQAQASIITLTYELGDYKSLWRELRLYAVRFGEKSPWARSQKSRSVVAETQKSIRDLLLYYAKLTHKNSQKSDKALALSKEAEKGYRLYLSFYNNSPQSVEVRFNLADLYYFRKQFTTAGKFYLEVATLGKNKAMIVNEEGKKVKNIHKESSNYMLDSFYKAFEPDLKKILAEKKPPDLSRPQRPLSSRASNFIKACGSYLKWYPRDHKIQKNCNVFIAETYYRHNDRKNAINYLWVVARKYPGSPEGKKAVTSLLPLYKDDQKSLNLALLELIKIPAYSQGEIGTKIRGLLRGVDEETVNREKDLKNKAKGYLKLASRYPNSKDVYKYYYNAAVTFIEAGDYASALNADKIVVSRFPKVPEAEISLLRMAEMSANLIEYENALKYYKLYSQRYPKTAKTAQALRQLCDLSIIITHNPQQIIANCQPLRTRDPAAYNARIEDIILTLYARREYSSMQQVVSFYLKLPGLSGAQRVKALYKNYVASNKKGGAQNSYARQIIALFRSSRSAVASDPIALRAVAEIVYASALSTVQPFYRVKLRGGTLANMERSIAQKTQALQKLGQAFSEVIQVQDAYWGVAAQYQIGLAWERISKAYAEPPGIKGAKLEDVKKQLAPLSQEAYKKSLNFYRKAAQDSNRYDIYSEHNRLITEALLRQKAPQFSTDDWVLMPDFLGSPISPKLADQLR